MVFFCLLMRVWYKAAMRNWEIECDDLGINVRRRPAPPAMVADPLAELRLRYPNGVLRTTVDDLTGASVLEVDVKDWATARANELECYGVYWHSRTGRYFGAGMTPEEESEADQLAAQRAAVDKYLANLKRSTELRDQHVRVSTTDFERREKIIADGMRDEDDCCSGIHHAARAEAARIQRTLAPNSTGGFVALLKEFGTVS